MVAKRQLIRDKAFIIVKNNNKERILQ